MQNEFSLPFPSPFSNLHDDDIDICRALSKTKTVNIRKSPTGKGRKEKQVKKSLKRKKKKPRIVEDKVDTAVSARLI